MNLNNQKLMNGIFLCLVPLMIESYSIINSLIISASIFVLQIISNMVITFIYQRVAKTKYNTPIALGVFVIMPLILALICSLIFKGFSSDITDICCYVVITLILLNTIVDFKYVNIKANVLSCLPSVTILSAILIVIGFIREILGLGSFFGFKLSIGNLAPIGLFNQTSGGLLLLGIIVVLYSLLHNKGKEEDR